MARNQMPSAQKTVTPATPDAGFVTRPISSGVVPPMRGGTAGVIPSQAPRAASQQGHVVGNATRPERDGAPKSRTYRVVNGGHVVLNGFRVAMRAGKIIENTQYDVQGLLDQGLVLDEIDPQPAPVAVVEKAADEEQAIEATA